MIKDPITAKVLGLLFFVFPSIIDGSVIIGARARGETRPLFYVMALLPSLPLFAFGAWLLKKGLAMRDPQD